MSCPQSTVSTRIVTMDMLQASPAVRKVVQLVGLSEQLLDDRAFARQALRLIIPPAL